MVRRINEAKAMKQTSGMPLRKTFALLVPREHGSWGMLFTVLFLPRLLFQLDSAATALGVAAVAMFFAKRPIESILQPRRPASEHQIARWWIFLLLPFAGLATILALIQRAADLLAVLTLGAAIVIMIGFGTYMELPHRHRGSFGVRLVPMMGVALFIPLQCLLSAQNMQAAWGLALFVFLFFMTSAIRVRARVRGRNSRWIRPVGAVVTIVSPIIIFVLGTTTTFVASYSFVPLLPGVIHTLYSLLSTNKSKPRMARLGMQEIIHTALFLFLTIFSYVSNLP